MILKLSGSESHALQPWTFFGLSRTIAAIYGLIGLFLLGRFLQENARDPYKCTALLQDGGYWHPHADDAAEPDWSRWQPFGCLLRNYTWPDVRQCYQGRSIVFAGDSIVRNPFTALLNMHNDTLSQSFATARRGDFQAKVEGVHLEFLWDAYGNYSKSFAAMDSYFNGSFEAPGFFFWGTGLWYGQDYPETEYLAEFQDAVDRFLFMTGSTEVESRSDMGPHRMPWVVNPVQRQRYDSIKQGYPRPWYRSGMAEGMNAYMASKPITTNAIIASSFVQMLAYSGAYRSDGLHVNEPVDRMRTVILLNYYCNGNLSSSNPKSLQPIGECCAAYPTWSWHQWLLMLFAGLSMLALLMEAPHRLLENETTGRIESFKDALVYRILQMETILYPAGSETHNVHVRFERFNQHMRQLVPSIIPLIGILWYVLMIDRTYFVGKRDKLHMTSEILVLASTALVTGISTLNRSICHACGPEDRPKLLCREHTDEIKGVLVVILSLLEWRARGLNPITPNSVDIIVAAYIFLLAFGNSTDLIRKSDYLLIGTKLVQLNALSLAICFILPGGSPTLSVTLGISCCLLIVYATMYVGRERNNSLGFVSFKLFLSFELIRNIRNQDTLWLGGPMQTSNPNTFDWQHSMSIGMTALFAGQLCSSVLDTIYKSNRSENCETAEAFVSLDSRHKATPLQTSTHLLLVRSLWVAWLFLVLAIFYSYASWPYFIDWHAIFTPLLLFTTAHLRSLRPIADHHSTAFAWLGRHALELFILRQHVWLAADGTAIPRLNLFPSYTPILSPNTWLATSSLESVILLIPLLWASGQARASVMGLAAMFQGDGEIHGGEM